MTEPTPATPPDAGFTTTALPRLELSPRRRFLSILVTVTAGLLFSLVAFAATKWSQQRALELDLQGRARNLAAELQRSGVREILERRFEHLLDIRDLSSGRDPDAQWLAQFRTETLVTRSFSVSLLWIPEVADANRDLYQAARRREGHPRFHIVEGPDRQAAPRRDEYFPVHLIEPPEAPDPVWLGVDLAADPLLRLSMDTARDAGRSTIIGQLPGETEPAKENVWFHFVPVYAGGATPRTLVERREDLKGFVAAAIRSRIRPTSPYITEGIDVLLVPTGASAPHTKPPLQSAWSLLWADSFSLPHHRGGPALELAGRSWDVLSRPRLALLARQSTWHTWAVLAAGLLGTTLFALYLGKSQGQSERIRRLVTKRTKQLSKANQNLERQIAERKIALEALQESEERFRTLFQFAPDAYYLHDLDGNILDGNLAARRLLGYEASDLAGKTYRDLAIFPEEQLAKVEALLNRNREGEATGPDELILTHKNGEHVVVEIRTHPVKLDDRLVVLGIARDITHRKRAEEALRESEERYALAARGASDGLWDWDLERDRIYYSPRWKEMLGFKDEEIGNAASDWFDRVHPNDLHSLRQAIQEHLRGESSHFENEHRLRDSRGRYRWMLSRGIAVLRSDGKPHRMAGSQTDVTERKAAEEQLQHDAFHDALTGLPNRALFMDRLERALRGTRRGRDTSLAVLFLDIDRFKVVNDSLGHLVGDQLLVAIARRLRGCVRPEDTVARLGGDEFTILISLIADLSDVTRVTDRIQTALRRPFDLDGQEVFVTASIGIALNSGGYDRASQLLRDADTAMYRAKTQGRDRHELFDHEMHAEAVALLKLETDLRRALQKREFRIHYQPIVEFESRRIRALEALLRWKHPERGYIDPAEFIKVAEETGLLLPLGNWVLEESCRQMKQWLADLDPSIARELSVNVNFSARQFQQSDLSERVRDALKQSGLPACHLRLEITEAALMDDAERNVEVIREIQHLGVRVLIDDFGTGYSSLSYLHRSHIEALKIDRSLVRNLTSGDENKEIVSAIATLGRSLGIDVIAEGVETPEQETSLREVHCRMGQGYLFFKPMDSDAVAQLLNDPRTKESFVRS